MHIHLEYIKETWTTEVTELQVHVLWATGASGLNQSEIPKAPDGSFNCVEILFILRQQSRNRRPWICVSFLPVFVARLSFLTWINPELYNLGNSTWAGLKSQLRTTSADSAPPEKAVSPCRHKRYLGGWKQHFFWGWQSSLGMFKHFLKYKVGTSNPDIRPTPMGSSLDDQRMVVLWMVSFTSSIHNINCWVPSSWPSPELPLIRKRLTCYRLTWKNKQTGKHSAQLICGIPDIFQSFVFACFNSSDVM